MRQALAFDVYGTLIDTAGVVSELRQIVGDQAETFSALWREKQLEYSFRRALMRRYEDFSVCVRDAMEFTAATLGFELSDEQKSRLLGVFGQLPAFADATDCLDQIAGSEFDVYALSNGSRAAVDKLLTGAGIRERFVDIVSVEEVRTFKPDPAVYQRFLERAGVAGDRAWLISGNPFDVIGAIGAGMRAVWVKRNERAVFDPFGFEPTITIPSLAGLKGGLEAFASSQRYA